MAFPASRDRDAFPGPHLQHGTIEGCEFNAALDEEHESQDARSIVRLIVPQSA